MIWHNLRKKPEPWKYVLAETTSKRLRLRVVYYTDNGWWCSAYSSAKSFQSANKKPKFHRSDFRIKRWAYIEDILNIK